MKLLGGLLLLALVATWSCGRAGRPMRTPPEPPGAAPAAPTPTLDPPPESAETLPPPDFDLQVPDFGPGGAPGLDEDDDDGGN